MICSLVVSVAVKVAIPELLVVPVTVGLVVALDALTLAIPRIPSALLESPAALNESEWPRDAPLMLSWSWLPTTENVALAPASAAGEPPGPGACN